MEVPFQRGVLEVPLIGLSARRMRRVALAGPVHSMRGFSLAVSCVLFSEPCGLSEPRTQGLLRSLSDAAKRIIQFCSADVVPSFAGLPFSASADAKCGAHRRELFRR